ncbi:D-alanyl-D-alanine carboxypeptidase family protein [Peribacillus asahii]|uniref:D-alanyl-D-alanine carboxypeptidase family protein n=1 Tax=Peribacillus asahii TaxID=228899 RepID=UPI002079F851|nr:hypothetical protein [Peribacillus asahii]USK62410.1 hypothetical protein LIT37_23275 [Peribacillus asahii]
MIKPKFISMLSLPSKISLLVFLLFIWRNEPTNAKEDIQYDINADAWVVMESETGKVLLDKNMNKQNFPASITKIITAIIAIEERELSEIVMVSEHAQNTEGSSLSLKAGDQISLLDLLYGIMLHSGNDGAVAVAEHISTNETDFAQKMTSFVKSIGAKNSHFTNASGLPNNEHYTTAYDMAIITRYAMKNAFFKEMVQHKTYNWDEQLWRDTLMTHEKSEAKEYGIAWEGKPKIINHNRLLGLYEGATGIKNGFTHESRYTLVGSANRNGSELIAVVLKSANVDTAYKDIITLLDEGFRIKKASSDQVKRINEEVSTNNVVEESVLDNSNSKETESNSTIPIENQIIYASILGIITFLILTFWVKIRSKK